jgi:hypothetical protein
VERQQLKWFTVAVAAELVLTPGLGAVAEQVAPVLGELVVFPVSLSLIPIAIGIAVLRYRLYDIDRIINRNFSDFREISYKENQTYAGHKGAVVFEYETVRDGRRVHVRHINLKGRSWATTSSSSSRPGSGTPPKARPASSSRRSSRSARPG